MTDRLRGIELLFEFMFQAPKDFSFLIQTTWDNYLLADQQPAKSLCKVILCVAALRRHIGNGEAIFM